MSFVEGLRQEQAEEALRQQRSKAQQEAVEKEGLQKGAAERERREQRYQKAKDFREESKVSDVVDKLGDFLATPTILITQTWIANTGGYQIGNKEGFSGRGDSYGPTTSGESLSANQRDPDSVFDVVWWDRVSHGYSKTGRKNYSKKSIVVESCPDGAIIFHGGWFGSTAISVEQWRSGNKERIFDKALKKAYERPARHRYSLEAPRGGGFTG